MGRPTKRTQHCRELARKRRKPVDSLYSTILTDNTPINNNSYFTDNAIEDESSEFEMCEWNDDFCARHILAAQEDFRANKPLLQEVIESMGHKTIFYPKFHPE